MSATTGRPAVAVLLPATAERDPSSPSSARGGFDADPVVRRRASWPRCWPRAATSPSASSTSRARPIGGRLDAPPRRPGATSRRCSSSTPRPRPARHHGARPRGRRVPDPPLLRRVDPLADRGDVHPLRRRRRRQRPRPPGRRSSRPTGAQRGQLIAVFNPKGGVGKTTIATNLAADARGSAAQRVLLVDADTVTGHVADLARHGRRADGRRRVARRARRRAGRSRSTSRRRPTRPACKVLPLSSSPIHTEVLDPDAGRHGAHRRPPRPSTS